MQNLEQIRAARALKATAAGNESKISRCDVADFPALILGNGLLSAVAFACEEKSDRQGRRAACDETAQHLAQDIIGIGILRGVTTGKDLVRRLSSPPATSIDLQRATIEALAFFNYLKRFAKPKERRKQTS